MEIDLFDPHKSSRSEKKQTEAKKAEPKLSVKEIEGGRFQVILLTQDKKVSATAHSPLNAYRMAKLQASSL